MEGQFVPRHGGGGPSPGTAGRRLEPLRAALEASRMDGCAYGAGDTTGIAVLLAFVEDSARASALPMTTALSGLYRMFRSCAFAGGVKSSSTSAVRYRRFVSETPERGRRGCSRSTASRYERARMTCRRNAA